jgi:tRNA/tmRNA/rRNA uracil-C5-methylase (TrmA/RlmC/RlmD family)
MIEPTAIMELRTGAMAAGGGCVARADDGRVVFVRHALPGELVAAQITSETNSYLRADAVDVLEASPDRVAPPCPHAGPGRCGGCDWQHIALPVQRSLKAALIAEQLQRLAGIHPAVEVEVVPGVAEGLGWRTRVQFAVDRSGRAGLRRHRSHDVEPIDRCLIAAPGVEAVGAEGHLWPGAAEVEVVASPDGAQRVASVTSAGRRLGPLPDVDAGIIADGRPVRPPYGVRHTIFGRTFEVAAGVFWQVHPGAAETIARAVLDGLEPRPGDKVLDLYAGAGLFAALLGDAVGPAGSVLAVERDRRASAGAARNTADQPHVKVRTATVDPRLIASRAARTDLVVLDPPRAGAGKAVAGALAGLSPRRVAYVACDPASFARDLGILLGAGWTMPGLRAFDIFPMTEHVELVAILEPPEGVVSGDRR